MNYLLYNPLANNNQGEKTKEEALVYLKDKYKDLNILNVLELDSKEFINNLSPDDIVIIVGGDGTLNHVANSVANMPLESKLYLYKAGTGNDFLRDLKVGDKLTLLNPYLKNLPKVKINGKESYFINGIGFGIDGMVCEVSDDLKAKGKTKINYTAISIKLLLGKYKCPNAKVIVDGETINLKKVWIASAMNGKYYGGGMMVAPYQERLSDSLSCVVMHKASRMKILFLFLKIFKGQHILKKKYCYFKTAKHIEVVFDKPTSLQIDGETVRNVTSYEVWK